MEHRYIECEAFTTIIDKKDCAYHRKLGWSKTEWHTHNRGQLIYAEYGIMRLYVEDKIYYIPSWHAAWIPQGVKHKVMTESHDLLFYTVYLDCTGLNNPFYRTVSIFPVSALLKEMITYTRKWQLKGEQDDFEKHFLTSVKHILPDFAISPTNLHVPVPENPILFAITQHIQQHYSDKLSASTLAEEFGISERNMNRLFNKELGLSFIKYHKLTRIVKAAELLSTPGKTVSEVCFETGYESVPSFTRTFKEIMGSSPTTLYRKKDGDNALLRKD